MFLRKSWLFTIMIFLLLTFIPWAEQPVDAAAVFLSLNVTPSNISFNILNPEVGRDYYVCNQEVIIESYHTFFLFPLPWNIGIRAAGGFLVDSINPSNKIPISRLYWSKDGSNFKNLSEVWTYVNSYYDYPEKVKKETIYYRLYNEPGKALPAGLYTGRIEFDARYTNFPWS